MKSFNLQSKLSGLLTGLTLMTSALALLGSASLLLAQPQAGANPLRLGSLFQNGMVLQQQTEAPVWGWSEPGKTISVEGSWQNEAVTATADSKGKWTAKVPTPKAGGPYTLTITGDTIITLNNLMIGEVWVCGGQSNMMMLFHRMKGKTVIAIDNYEQEAKDANYPDIRVFRATGATRQPTTEPLDTCRGNWQAVSPEIAMGLSAAPYFFARHLHKELNVPVGVIVNAVGGSSIEQWMPPEGFEAVPSLKTAEAQRPQGWSSLYFTSTYPLAPFAIRGVIWYQGENNVGQHMEYGDRMRALIKGWRSVWGQGDFPFYYVQLSPNGNGNDPFNLPKIWEAQASALVEPNTGWIPISDIGDVGNIHPSNKQDVGKRLANMALAKTYGRKDLVCDGPQFKSMKLQGSTAVITFDTGGGKLASRDGQALTHFTIAGADKVFKPATAVIDGDNVIVSSSDVTAPEAVRFGWSSDAQPNLMNSAGLPAFPFRTDDWPLAAK